jgi:hypothetical protein
MNAYEATMEYQITQNRKISSQNNYNKYRIFPIFRWFWKKKSFPAEEMVLFAESNLREAKEGLWDCRALLSQVDAMVTKLEVLLSVIQATYTNGVTISLGNDQQV